MFSTNIFIFSPSYFLTPLTRPAVELIARWSWWGKCLMSGPDTSLWRRENLARFITTIVRHIYCCICENDGGNTLRISGWLMPPGAAGSTAMGGKTMQRKAFIRGKPELLYAVAALFHFKHFCSSQINYLWVYFRRSKTIPKDLLIQFSTLLHSLQKFPLKLIQVQNTSYRSKQTSEITCQCKSQHVSFPVFLLDLTATSFMQTEVHMMQTI